MAIVCMFAMLTGCVQQDIGVAINADGTGTVSATIGIEEDAYEQLVGMGSDILEGKETSTYEHDGKIYVSYTETKNYENYEDIEKALLKMTYESDVFEGLDTEDFESEVSEESAGATELTPIFKSVTIEKNTGLFYSTYTFKAELNPREAIETEDTGIEFPIDTDSFRMTFTVTMPSDITQANGATVEGNKAVFEIDDITEAQEVSVVCEQNNVAAVVLIVVVLLVVLVLFFFLTKRKGN
jgi:uncharacterized membrane protein